jgi:predicted DNA-binding transcriptional regulator AlpA
MTIPDNKSLPDNLGLERILSAHQAAEMLGISVATFRRQYWAGKTPPAVRVSDRRLGWRAQSLIEHVAQRAA